MHADRIATDPQASSESSIHEPGRRSTITQWAARADRGTRSAAILTFRMWLALTMTGMVPMTVSSASLPYGATT